jgi:gamma-glutamyltranspeptidase / glutathione hydrolase
LPEWGNQADAQGRYGVVSSVEQSASEVGIAILEAGGNAVDAAIATAFALAVTHPSAGNIGGGGFLLLKSGSQVTAVDFRENSPEALSDAAFWKMIRAGGRGPVSVGVPGTVAGLHAAHERHGKLPWHDVVRPASLLAEQGYRLGKRQAQTIEWSASDLRKDPVARAAFFEGNQPKRPGSLITRPKLALALTRIMDQGPRGFYEGDTAQDIVASLGKEGLITLEDLKAYRPTFREPLCFDFQGVRIITMPAPSAGGVALSQTLLMLAAQQVENTSRGSPGRLHLFSETSRRAQAERQLFVVSPEALTESERGAHLARVLDPQTWLGAHPIAADKVTASSDLHPSYARLLAELEHTTHLSVIDAQGDLVSLTVTLSGSYGSRIFTKQTGIVLNNSTASFSSVGQNTPAPGRRTTSSMAPTLAIAPDGSALVLGSPGGDTIPSTLSQLLLHLTVDRLSLKEAVEAPRVHQTFAPGTLFTESERPLATELRAQLNAMGHKIVPRKSAIGDANVAGRVGENTFAVCDSREGGAALAATKVVPTE